jgi:hypothetical protein
MAFAREPQATSRQSYATPRRPPQDYLGFIRSNVDLVNTYHRGITPYPGAGSDEPIHSAMPAMSQ